MPTPNYIDTDAWYDEHRARIYQQLCFTSQSKEDAEDALHDGFLYSLGVVHPGTTSDDFRNLWIGNAKKKLLDIYRRGKTRRIHADRVRHERCDHVLPGIWRAAGLGEDGVDQDVQSCLTQLDEEEREVVEYVMDGYEQTDIATMLGRSDATITNRKQSGIAKLARCLLLNQRCVFISESPPDEWVSDDNVRGIAELIVSRELSKANEGELRVAWWDVSVVDHKGDDDLAHFTDFTDSSGGTFQIVENTLLFSLSHPELPTGKYHFCQLRLAGADNSLAEVTHDGKNKWGLPIHITVDPSTRLDETKVVYEYRGEDAKKRKSPTAVSLTFEIQF
ncbi:MAG: sigma factor-like helix-turn-helix DNA-binding protein [Planctomycetota bacterium]|nr:sigma factor-like helix-turn-helix DNA-binding protein [Planctomycetota bacterium]